MLVSEYLKQTSRSSDGGYVLGGLPEVLIDTRQWFAAIKQFTTLALEVLEELLLVFEVGEVEILNAAL